MDQPLLPALSAWVAGRAVPLAAEGIVVHVDESPSGWAKASMTVALDGPRAVGRLTVWDTGEAELEYGVIATGQVECEHRDLASARDLRQALADLTGRLRGGRHRREAGCEAGARAGEATHIENGLGED
ncbi:immunity protein TriTu family protein [Actinacidiphila yeochonensis]|uniref:immunity protein TriTu family protein n=1 Tax=Actinacidiphila yeochonensis TaxID=89050 RepID=UPI00068ADF19|nr:hypothetical protein [Actinacidiphila yeochonensis]